MPDRVYLRPVGFLYGEAAREAIESGVAGPLAGGLAAFSIIELIEGAPGKARRRMHGFGKLVGSSEGALKVLFERITTRRPALGRLTLDRPRLMGVVNVTPDSFSDGGLYDQTDVAIRHAAELSAAGAEIVDIGGESTRPGADPVSVEEELGRVLPVLEGLKGSRAVLSIDTRKAQVMRAAAKAGVGILNDVSALSHDPDSLVVAAATRLPVILMHAQGGPRTMQKHPHYDDVLLEVFDYLAARIEACGQVGIPRERVIVDPGIGFGKTLEHNLALLSGLSLLHGLGVPVLLGASRKRFIGALTGVSDPLQREAGSAAAALAGAAQGAQILRVHDVRATRQALTVWRAATLGRENA